MTIFFYLRAGLLSAALLLTSAIASPAFAESLPEISPRQIASDVERVKNPDTGVYEYIAPSFDPFEQDRSMAGSASLRSISTGTTIDGQSIRRGALLDMSFYYNSSSNDPYDTRGFEEAVFLSGDYAPVTLRDNRILECNENVQDVVYYHEDYYRPSLYVNLYRPYRYYSGHYLYDGFRGSRGYNYGRSYNRNRGFGSRSRIRSRIRNTRRNNRVRETDREDRTDSRRRVNRDTTRTRTREERRNREGGREYRRDGSAATTRHFQRDEAERSNRRDTRRNGRAGQTANTQTGHLDTAARVTPQTGRAENRARAVEKSKNAPKRHSGRKGRSQTRNKNSQSKNSQSNNRSQTRSKTRGSARSQTRNRVSSKLKLINLLPMASVFSRNVVRNVDVQCAREEMLSIHIPQERLDAARFDGLTVLVLDRAGDEIPVYVPPNYIEGFRRAAGGGATPNVAYQEPRSPAPVYQAPPSRPAIESAPCPVGTSKQADGTCLQGGTTSYGGYPTR